VTSLRANNVAYSATTCYHSVLQLTSGLHYCTGHGTVQCYTVSLRSCTGFVNDRSLVRRSPNLYQIVNLLHMLCSPTQPTVPSERAQEGKGWIEGMGLTERVNVARSGRGWDGGDAWEETKAEEREEVYCVKINFPNTVIWTRPSPPQKISSKSVLNLSSYPAHRHTETHRRSRDRIT